MTRFINSNLACMAILVFCIAGVSQARVALAQESEADLRRQNQQLAAEVEDLEKQLDAARERQKELEDRIADLEAKLAAALKGSTTTTPKSGGGPAIPAEEVTVDESVPTASPRALFKSLIASYEEATAGLEIGRFLPGGTAGGGPDRDRRNYLKRLEAWRTSANREFRAPIKWHVRVIDARVGPDNQRIITLVAVDPVTDVRLGNTFDVVLSQSLADRLARYQERGGGEIGVLVLRGTLIPQVRINPDRDVRGTFDNPPFIGPFAEFLYRIDVTSLIHPRDEPADARPPREKSGSTGTPPPPTSPPSK